MYENTERSIDDFKGNAVVIGCSHKHLRCEGHLHQGNDIFYTIDVDPRQKPDFEFNITHKLPTTFNKRFKLTLLECIDHTAYSVWGHHKEGKQGFDNIWAMTEDEGFIVIIGCPRERI
jgi:hypothetical protein